MRTVVFSDRGGLYSCANVISNAAIGKIFSKYPDAYEKIILAKDSSFVQQKKDSLEILMADVENASNSNRMFAEFHIYEEELRKYGIYLMDIIIKAIDKYLASKRECWLCEESESIFNNEDGLFQKIVEESMLYFVNRVHYLERWDKECY